MSENTKIEWCDHTFNPWEGCQKVGPGCDHCYAETRNARFAGGTAINWGPGAPRRLTSLGNWNKPVQWHLRHDGFFKEHGRRQRVFCASLADVFDNAANPVWRTELFALIRTTPHLDWLLLTKRIGNVPLMVKAAGGWPANAHLGITVCNQDEADRDIIKALRAKARFKIPVLFLSMEPLLGPVKIDYIDIDGHSEIYPLRGTSGCEDDDGNPVEDLPAIDQVIAGGESGLDARSMHPDWARSLRDQCQDAGVPFHFKQWGEWKPINQMEESEYKVLYKPNVLAKPHEDQDNLNDIYGRRCTVPTTVQHADGSVHDITEPMAFLQGSQAMQIFRVGKKAAGRLLDGVEHNGFPE